MIVQALPQALSAHLHMRKCIMWLATAPRIAKFDREAGREVCIVRLAENIPLRSIVELLKNVVLCIVLHFDL